MIITVMMPVMPVMMAVMVMVVAMRVDGIIHEEAVRCIPASVRTPVPVVAAAVTAPGSVHKVKYDDNKYYNENHQDKPCCHGIHSFFLCSFHCNRTAVKDAKI